MIQKIQIYTGRSVNPHYNLAVEQYLLESVEPGCCVLYLWQNQNTVVIGRNQNAWKECRTTLLEEEGGRLARRLSGGGAVFHDLGNLNFTFLLSEKDYDVRKQQTVIQRACRNLGIAAEISGRNDLLAEGRKFSGNAFYKSGGRAYHHGTLMVDVDMEKLTRYLSPSRSKLETKGVSSVRSRVVNLAGLSPGLTCRRMAEHIEAAFEEIYGMTAERISEASLDMEAIEALHRKNESWEWLYGSRLPFTFVCEKHCPWGEIQIQILAKEGIIQDVKVYSDSMDWSLPRRVEEALTGCRFSLQEMRSALRDGLGDETYSRDIGKLLAEQEL